MVTVEDFQLPEELLAVLPTDPFEQLDVARKISCMAMAARVSKLEAETGKLRQKLTEKENTIFNLQQHVRELEQLMEENKARLSNALEEQTKLTNEKNVLLATVKKLNRDVVKLETFKRTLMQSLQEDEEQRDDGERITRHSSLNFSLSSANPSKDPDASSRLHIGDDGSGTVSARSTQPAFSSLQSVAELARVSPIAEHHADVDGSPKRQSGAGSPTRQPASGSPKSHSISDARLALSSSQPTSLHTTAPNSPPHPTTLPARTPRVDGKEFFRQARNRLSYEQFSGFLANIKELNAHHQTREETLKKADEIFGPDNKDLYLAFEGLLGRHLPS
eukprot:c27162_g1_i3 orf=472-1473(+)